MNKDVPVPNDKEIRHLISTSRDIDESISLLEVQIEARKSNHEDFEDLMKELKKLKLESQNLRSHIINTHSKVIGGAVKWVIERFGENDFTTGKRQAPQGIDRDDLRGEALKAFIEYLDAFSLDNENPFRSGVFNAMNCHLKKVLGYNGLKTKQPKEIMWGIECLQKLSLVKQQESYEQGREVSIEEVCKILKVPMRHVKALSSVCFDLEPLEQKSDSGETFYISDHYNQIDDTFFEYESEITKAQLQQVGQMAKMACEENERQALFLSYGTPEFYVICIDEIAKEHPAIRRRIKQIENEVLENVTDEGLLASLRGFFALRAKHSSKPFPDLLKRIGLDYLNVHDQS